MTLQGETPLSLHRWNWDGQHGLVLKGVMEFSGMEAGVSSLEMEALEDRVRPTAGALVAQVR